MTNDNETNTGGRVAGYGSSSNGSQSSGSWAPMIPWPGHSKSVHQTDSGLYNNLTPIWPKG